MNKYIKRVGDFGYCTIYERGDIIVIHKIHGNIRNIILEYGKKIGDIIEKEGSYVLKEKDLILNKILDIIYKFIT